MSPPRVTVGKSSFARFRASAHATEQQDAGLRIVIGFAAIGLITDSSLRGYTGRNENAIRNGRFDSVYLSVFVLIKKTFSRSLLTTDFEKFFVHK